MADSGKQGSLGARLDWKCQACGRTVVEWHEDRAAAERRCYELEDLRKAECRVCDQCDGVVKSCERCGACCVFNWLIDAEMNDDIRAGHLTEVEGGFDGYLRRRRKPWSQGHRVCMFQGRSANGSTCRLHGRDTQPVTCQEFRCRLPDDRAIHREFLRFRERWIRDGHHRIFWTEEDSDGAA